MDAGAAVRGRTLARAGHILNLDEPEGFNAELLAFLDELRAAAA